MVVVVVECAILLHYCRLIAAAAAGVVVGMSAIDCSLVALHLAAETASHHSRKTKLLVNLLKTEKPYKLP